MSERYWLWGRRKDGWWVVRRGRAVAWLSMHKRTAEQLVEICNR